MNMGLKTARLSGLKTTPAIAKNNLKLEKGFTSKIQSVYIKSSLEEQRRNIEVIQKKKKRKQIKSIMKNTKMTFVPE